jgi:dipeptidyl aminopeptidase/acylaminoacyl peptidase
VHQRGVYIGSLDGGTWTRVLDSPLNAVNAPGYLLTVRDGNLLAYPFDETKRQITGSPTQLAETVGGSSALLAAFSVSTTGVLAYANGLASLPGQLTWFNRQGQLVGVVTETGYYVDFRLSPNERQLALTQVDATGNSDLWLLDLARGVPTRFTADPAPDVAPIWSADGNKVIFRSDRGGLSELFEKPSGGSAVEHRLAQIEAWFPSDLSPDGRFVLFHTPRTLNLFDIMLLPLSGDPKPSAYVDSMFNDIGGRFSPDGRWVAYASDESGQMEVYVQSFPRTDRGRRISTGGGSEPRWRGDGQELFYLASDGTLMGVPVRGTKTFESGTPQRLFRTQVPVFGSPYRSNYEVTSDGQRFLVNTLVPGAVSEPIEVVLNWTTRLKK